MKYILITGAASGIGKSITELMAKRGWTVFATDVNKDVLRSMSGKNIIPVYMDVTKEKTIIDAYKRIVKETIYLDVILNNAGIFNMSSLIEDGVDETKKVIDVNLYGMMRVNKVFYPLLNKESGRIINISSECGWMSPSPFSGPYTISKYAVEAYNDTLRRELNYLGVKVIKIEPGSFKTAIHKTTVDSFKKLINNTKYFKEQLSSMSKMIKKELDNSNDMIYMHKAIIHACESDKPKICYRVKNSKSLCAVNLLPEKMIDGVYKNSLK